MDIYYYCLFWIIILGLCLGSFYNVVILRSLSNESIVFPPSKCPKCNHKLYVWHNIPVISYILLKGKCYFCNEKISIQYPIIELSTAILFALTYIKYGISWYTVLLLIVISGLIIMTVTDLKERLADCNIAIIIAVSGLIYNGFINGWQGLLNSFEGLVICVLILELIARLGYIFIKSRAMGEADTYVAGALGAMFGFPAALYVLLYGFIASMIFIVPVFFYNQFKANNKMTCILGILFTLSALIFKTINSSYFTLLTLFFSGILLSISIIRSTSTGESRNYLPYIPALFAGLIIYLTLA